MKRSAPRRYRQPSTFTMVSRVCLLFWGLVGAPLALSAGMLSGATLDRDGDPVVMTGSDLARLLGLVPQRIVAFKYALGWIQIPVQVDERAVVDFGTVYNSDPTGLVTLAYADPETFMGADPDATFDEDDELVFMAGDAGERVPGGVGDPTGVVPGIRVEVVVTDPIASATGYVYLFETNGSLPPGAGVDYVDYDFVLLSGPYLTTYDTMSGPNPENSQVTTANYREHFSDRWIRNETNIYAGGSSGEDMLDRHKNLFAPGNCARSENTFSAGEGAFFANIDGPVRAVRSYLGANSGPLTQRDHFFYEKRHDIVTHLRVHAISGIMDFYDYSPLAAGLTYYNDLNLGGVTIDGSPETITPGPLVWEMVTGTQGTLVHASSVDTDMPGFSYTSYYLDDSTPPVTQCTGDDFAYGSSGIWINVPIPNTDPSLGAHSLFVARRAVYFEAPHQNVALAAKRHAQAAQPLLAAASPPTAAEASAPPARYRLEQAVPNPFRHETIVRFEAPPGQSVSVRVYDVRGRLIRTLFDGASPGHGGAAIWDGTDERGVAVSSGIYFYRLVGPGFSQARKMALID